MTLKFIIAIITKDIILFSLIAGYMAGILTWVIFNALAGKEIKEDD